MENNAVWGSSNGRYPEFKGNCNREIVVVGGGIAGVLTAFKLAESGKQVTLLEADRLFCGTSGRTTAKITYNQGNVYAEIYASYGKQTARLYLNSQTDGINGFLQLIERYSIDCDLTETESYIFSRDTGERLKRTCNIMRELGADCTFVSEGLQPVKATCAIKAEKQYVFDPVKFLNGLPKKFEIFEHTRVEDVDAINRIITCSGGVIKADIIIIATHFPIINSRGVFPFKLRQSMSYTLATDEKITDKAFLDEKDDGISLRPFSGGTLIGGCDHRTGRIYDSCHFSKLKRLAQEEFNVKGFTHEWAAQDVMTFDKMPMAGLYSKNTGGVFVITGFNKWGMTNSMVCSDLICDLVTGKTNPYAEIFSPQRRIPGSFGNFMSNAMTNVKEIFLGYFRITFKKCVPKGSGRIVRYHGKKRAVYRDENGKLYIIGTMCPHLHGELKWNGDTHTWDCPCHGSRFDIFGNVISEPSTKCCKFEEGTRCQPHENTSKRGF